MNELLVKVKRNEFVLGILGIGRVGLPLGLCFANSGVNVIGMDKSEEYVNKLKRNEKPFEEEGIEDLLKNKNFTPTNDITWGIEKSNVIIITIGTPIGEHMRTDYSQLYSALESLVNANIRGKIIIMRSSASAGTLENTIKPFLEKKTGLKAGIDFGLSVCPERILEGKAILEIRDLPEIIGGINEISSEITKEVFKKINPNKKIFITTPKSAELAKLFTNVYRYINFALANEFGLIAEDYGEDGHEIINILNSGYSRGGVPIPGLAGGPCLSKDGYYLTHNIPFPDFILMAWRLNEAIPQYIVNKLRKYFNDKGKQFHECKVAILGLTFKADIDDTRYSPVIGLVEALKSENVHVKIHDPHLKNTDKLEEALDNCDAIILAMPHSKFNYIHRQIAELKKHKENCLVYDCWGFFNEDEIRNLGFDYMKFGSGKIFKH